MFKAIGVHGKTKANHSCTEEIDNAQIANYKRNRYSASFKKQDSAPIDAAWFFSHASDD